MKHLTLLSSLVILLLASCTKQELLFPQEQNETTPNQAAELSNNSNLLKSNYIKDDTQIFYDYFLDGQMVEGDPYDVNDPSLWIQLIATSSTKKGAEVLNYEFHAYTDEYEFTLWAEERNILVKEAFDITSTLAASPTNGETRHKFEQYGEIPTSYRDYVNNTVDGILMQTLGNVEMAPTDFLLFRNVLNNGSIKMVDGDCLPIFTDQWNNSISGLQGNNLYLPTVLFEDDFYQNRINLTIYNKSGHPIIFQGPLEGLNNRISSIF